ncbi:MAG TPA: pilus assembly protein PilM [Rhodocyclaceae bacterium]|nr:pilus assembly protein PilM [Rhodocyclaceae bacterium]
MNLRTLEQRLALPIFGRRRAAPIGTDFAAERLNMLQMETRDGATAVRAAISMPYPGERDALFADTRKLKSFVQAALSDAPFSGRRVYSSLPPADVRILPLTAQVAAGQSEAQAVAKAVREHLGVAVAESVVDYCQVRSLEAEGPERQVLVAVAQQRKVLAYLDTLRAAGFDPVALDIGPAAIARLLAAMHREDYEQSVLLINFGLNKSFLTVVWGRRLMLDREIDFGETKLASKLANSLGLEQDIALALLREHGIGGPGRGQHTDGAAPLDVGRTIREILHPELALLAEELSRTQVYVASRTRGGSVSRVYLNGSAARYPNIQSRISELVALPVDVLNPFDAFATAPSVTPGADVEQGIALAAGLALREDRHG